MFLGYRLRLLRKSRAMSQDELGKALGVSKVSISGYENGVRIPSMEVLLKILSVFNVSADYMLGRDLTAVCEDDNTEVVLSTKDIDILHSLKKKPTLYNKIADNPKRFFETNVKK